MPSCCIIPNVSQFVYSSITFPFASRERVSPETFTCLPVGATPHQVECVPGGLAGLLVDGGGHDGLLPDRAASACPKPVDAVET